MPGAEKILVRGVNWLGDAVMTTPALQRLREVKPDAHITLLTREKLADLWRGHPSLNATISFSAAESVFNVAGKLRRELFDTALLFPNSPRSALEALFARIPSRVGYARNWRGLFLTHTVPARVGAMHMHKHSRAQIEQRIAQNKPREIFPPSAHHTHDYLHLAAALGANPTPLPPLLHVSDEEVVTLRERFNWPVGKPVFALNPGAEYGPAKRWPSERFIELATQLHHKTSCHWVILGGRADRELALAIANAIVSGVGPANVTNIAGETSLRELCAVLKTCAVAVTNDTGPMHLAAALGTPVVVPFGSTSPEMTAPSSASNSPHEFIVGQVPCAPCFRRECPIDFRCMKSISVEQMVEAALRAWHRTGL
ncbi:MAG TPA: lipopolysaccharide heptosyltransferase II [Verrucomicrobiae bacterium]|jgi:heptosyltransferase-2